MCLVFRFQPSFGFVFLCVLFLNSNRVTAQGFTLAAFHPDGDPVSNGNVIENAVVHLRCRFDANPINVHLEIYNESGNAWEPQLYCSDTTITDTHDPSDESILPKLNATCSTEKFQADFKAIKSSPKQYKCKIFYAGQAEREQIYTLRTHTIPTSASIERSPDSTPTEDTQVNYTCQSTARPPPKLRFEYNGKIVQDGVYQDPEPSLIDVDNSSATSTIIWTTLVSSELNGIDLSCVVYDHPAYAKRTLGQYRMAVYYGPYDEPNHTIRWNIRDGDLTLSCDLRYNGDIVYEWYDDGDSGDASIANEKEYVLKADAFSNIASKETKQLSCIGTNSKNENREATIRFSVEIYNSSSTTTTPFISTSTSVVEETPGVTGKSKITTTSSSALEPYEIALIVVAIVVLVLIVLIIVAVIYRQRHSPAAKKKQAARESRNNGYGDQSGNSGGSKNTQPDVIRNSYIAPDVPRSPVSPGYNSGYSQHPEDYADALDDKPRSRRPVAYSMDDLNDSFDAPPSDTMVGGPPAYHPHDMYSNYPQRPDYSSYGAAC